MASHSCIFVWRILWTEKLAGYIPWVKRSRVRLNDSAHACTHTILAERSWSSCGLFASLSASGPVQPCLRMKSRARLKGCVRHHASLPSTGPMSTGSWWNNRNLLPGPSRQTVVCFPARASKRKSKTSCKLVISAASSLSWRREVRLREGKWLARVTQQMAGLSSDRATAGISPVHPWQMTSSLCASVFVPVKWEN